MALVDDVREGLERVERLLARPADPRVRLVDGYRHGNDRECVPRVVERSEREQRAQARLGCGGAEVGLEDLEASDHLEQTARDEQVCEREHRQPDEVVRKREVARVPAAQNEPVAGRERCEGIGGRLEGSEPHRGADEPRK